MLDLRVAGMFIVVSFAGRLVSTRSSTCCSSCSVSALFPEYGARAQSGGGRGTGGHGVRGVGPHHRLTAPVGWQVYYSLWRKLLKAFWWLVAYTMLVLVAVYTFQFQDFPAYWRNLNGPH